MNNARRSLRWRLAQWLELRWWRSYLRGQVPETYLRDKYAYWARLLQQISWSVTEGARVLDMGCGPAGIFMYLHDKQAVTAVDPLISQYEALDIFEQCNYPEVTFVQSGMEDYRSSASFEAVYCLNAINHVGDWSAALDTLTSVSRIGTRLLLSSDVHRHAWLMPLFRRLPGDALHPQQHNADDYRRALRLRGWHIERELVLRTERIFEYRAWVCTLSPSANP